MIEYATLSATVEANQAAQEECESRLRERASDRNEVKTSN